MRSFEDSQAYPKAEGATLQRSVFWQRGLVLSVWSHIYVPTFSLRWIRHNIVKSTEGGVKQNQTNSSRKKKKYK